MEQVQEQSGELISLAADIVSAYVSNNSVPAGDLPAFIGQVHAALQQTAIGAREPEPQPLTPAVAIRKSVTPDHIVCLEDGKKFKSLKRHLRTEHNMTPDEYRQKWGLSRDYPLVASNYAAKRSALAKSLGLGQQRRRAKTEVAPPAPAPRRKGGRPKKTAEA
jgi:MucR family transcriptional regulator, transcriptional regulator of exopolysaccharide biosynthesis